MANQVSVTTEDAGFRYRLTAQATSVTTASISEAKTDKNTQAVTNATYEISGVTVLNDVLQGSVHLPGFQTETFTLTRGPNSTVTIQTGGLWFGMGAQTIGPFTLNATDYDAVGSWETDNFAHN
jgi:hypothetical protein